MAGDPTDDWLTNGCPPPPPPDADEDGFVDAQDACPHEAGVASADPSLQGCPPPPNPDPDGDGIEGDADACPQAAGKPNPEPTLNGCPVVVITDKEIEIRQTVDFQNGKATILPQSFELLDTIADLMNAHPEILKVEVEGHTDSRGSAAYNRRLSEARAKAVAKHLTQKGVSSDRLITTGRGPDVPIADNETDEGRAKNRRVEFHIRQRAPAPE
jgi:outer membrane protein OmpA-like peptidoglycan-associated protein